VVVIQIIFVTCSSIEGKRWSKHVYGVKRGINSTTMKCATGSDIFLKENEDGWDTKDKQHCQSANRFS
jgi:hypothetical protein